MNERKNKMLVNNFLHNYIPKIIKLFVERVKINKIEKTILIQFNKIKNYLLKHLSTSYIAIMKFN